MRGVRIVISDPSGEIDGAANVAGRRAALLDSARRNEAAAWATRGSA